MADSTPDDTKHGPLEGSTSSAGAGAAVSRAPETPLPAKEAQDIGRRRSDRVTLTIPIEVSGTDLTGHSFTESCQTELVSLHGASIVVPRRASPAQPLTVRRRVLDSVVQARILGQLGIRSGSHVYGVAFIGDAPNFWGIFFPPPPKTDNTLGRTLLKCSQCGKHVIFALNEIEFRVFEANQRLSHPCDTCGRTVPWMPVPNEVKAAETGPGDAGLQDRKHVRTKMRAMACIQEPGRGDDVVQALDISRGGISFQGNRAYEVNCWINLAVPYMPGAANIFVAGRIVWRKDLADNQYEYGVQYVKG